MASFWAHNGAGPWRCLGLPCAGKGVLPVGAHVEMQQRAGAAQIYRESLRNGQGTKLDPVLRAHLGLDAFGESRDA